MSHLSYGRRTLSLKMAERTSDDEGERILEMVANDLFNLEQLAENPATKCIWKNLADVSLWTTMTRRRL